MKRLVIVLACTAPGLAHAETYVRAGAGYEHASQTGFRDRDCGAPAAVFGCGAAADGQPLTARGGFGSTATTDLGLGWRATPYVRLELQATFRPGLGFSGRSNFRDVPGGQPARADLDSLSGVAAAYADLGLYGRLRPFLGLGVGAARNRLGSLHLAAPASSVVLGGSRTGAAWMATAGVAWALDWRSSLDIAYRYTDLGDLRSAAAPFAPVHAHLVVQGVAASVRRSF